MAAASAIGGILNAVGTHNLSPWPRRIKIGNEPAITRPGLVLGIAVAALVGTVISAALLGATCVVSLNGRALPISAIATLVVGALAARYLTNEADKRMLRLAVLKAASAPAAHPDTVSAMWFAAPHQTFAIAAGLQVHSMTPIFGNVSPGFDA